MRINVAVSGRFHYHNVAPYLQKQGVLNRFYYAHKVSTGEKALGVPADKLVNIWIKEYLLQAHSRLPSALGFATLSPLYRWIWETGSLSKWSSCDLLHILLHGGGRRLMRRAHAEDAVVLGEPVNAHPDIQNEILNSEYERLKIDTILERSPMQKQMLEEFEMCDQFIVASDFIKRTFTDKGYAEDRIKVLPYGVDLARFSAVRDASQKRKPFRVICVAAINVRKGIVDLLEAWKRFSPPDGELLLIGRMDSDMSDVLRRYEGLFIHIPFVPNHELRRYFSESAVFVLPSLEDGFGLVCGEAMASGLPLITTTNTGASEIIDEDVNGYVVPIRSPDAIAEKLEILYQDREKAIAMGSNAAEKMKALQGWDGYGKELVGMYRSILSAKAD